jgi:hypothetical protein
MATEEQHAAAVVAALTTLQAHPYTLDTIPTPPPDFYTEVVVHRRFGGTQRGSGEREGELYRVLLRQVAKSLPNAQRLRAKSAGLEEVALTVAGQSTTPLVWEDPGDPIGPDDGWWSGTQTLTYNL